MNLLLFFFLVSLVIVFILLMMDLNYPKINILENKKYLIFWFFIFILIIFNLSYLDFIGEISCEGLDDVDDTYLSFKSYKN